MRAVHLWGTPPVEGAFARITRGVYTVSPELCLVQMAGILDHIELIRLLYELCGFYALSPDPVLVPESNEESELSSPLCAPLTSVDAVRAFAERASGMRVRGASRLLRALAHVVDGSASPMETVCIMLLCLPYRLGGYGLPLPQLNASLELPSARKRLTFRDDHRCDLLWPDHRVLLEYDGRKGHSGAARSDRDSRRDNAMASNNMLVIKVTGIQLYDVDAFDLVARQLMAIMHRRPRMDACSYDWEFRRGELRNRLLPGLALCNERVGRGVR